MKRLSPSELILLQRLIDNMEGNENEENNSNNDDNSCTDIDIYTNNNFGSRKRSSNNVFLDDEPKQEVVYTKKRLKPKPADGPLPEQETVDLCSTKGDMCPGHVTGSVKATEYVMVLKNYSVFRNAAALVRGL